MKRVYLSGAAKKRKIKEEEKEISKLSKITTFLDPSGNTVKDNCEMQNKIANENERILQDNLEIINTTNVSLQHVNALSEHDSLETAIICENRNPGIIENDECEKILHSEQISTNSDSQIINYSSDPAMWSKIDENLRFYWSEKGSALCNNKNMDFSKSARIYQEGDKQKVRTLSKNLFQIKLHNGELIDREWLLYSPSTGSVYYFMCRLFSTEMEQFSYHGFNDWKHSERIVEHEESKPHKQCLITYYKRKDKFKCIDSRIIIEQINEQKYWVEVLRRITDVIKFLASRGLAFRGDNQEIGCVHNGNYLGILELLMKYDPFLKQHISKYGNKGHGVTSYLSANICEEFIELMGKHVLSYIIAELKKGKYYSICVDSTPDTSHTDQLTITIRYVVDDSPIERFLMFLPIEEHGAEYLFEVIFDFLKTNDIDINDCRGQSYDNASNMSGRYNGLQARFKAVNKYADYIPCAAHSLNLVGLKAAECVVQVTSYFDFVQKLYTFFSASTCRWRKLSLALSPALKVPKTLSATRWSSRADAVSALYAGYDKIYKVLDEISVNDAQSNETRLEAKSLCNKMCKFDNIYLTVVWNDILNRINDTSKNLQMEKMDLNEAVCLLKSLELYLLNIRDQFSDYLEKAKSFTEIDFVIPQERTKQRSTKLTYFEGSSKEKQYDYEDRLRIQIFYPVIDSLYSNLKRRESAYEILSERFKFFTLLRKMDYQKIKESCNNLAVAYDKDICAEHLISECLQFKHYTNETGENEIMSLSEMYSIIKKRSLTSFFPNLEISLRIFLSLMITNCTGERTFWKLKIIKNDYRSTMTQSRLNFLSLLSIESKVALNINFEDLIADFAKKKCRRKVL